MYYSYGRHAFFTAIDSNGDDSIDFSELCDYIYPDTSSTVEDDTEQDDENKMDATRTVLKSSISHFDSV